MTRANFIEIRGSGGRRGGLLSPRPAGKISQKWKPKNGIVGVGKIRAESWGGEILLEPEPV